MCFFDFIKQNNGIRFTSYSLCKLSALFITHISRRSTYQTRYSMPFLVFAHVDSDHKILFVEKQFCQSSCKFGLSDSCAAEKGKGTYRSVFITQSATASSYRIRNSFYCLSLPDYTLSKFAFKIQKFIFLALHHLCNRYSRPFGNHFCNMVVIDFLCYQSTIGLHLFQFCFVVFQICFCCFYFSVSQFCNLTIIPCSFGLLCFKLISLDFLYFILNRIYKMLFLQPAFPQFVSFFFEAFYLG